VTAPIPEAAATVEDALHAALRDATRGRVTFPRDLQGFPGTVHGGAVAALLYRATTPRPPVTLQLQLPRGVRTETPCRLTTGSRGSVAVLNLLDGERHLAEATLDRAVEPAADAGPLLAAWRQAACDAAAEEVPGTATCLACGFGNPLGLQVRLRADARFVWREYTPRPAYRAADGRLHPGLATVMLDELGWWLGALNQKECGVTTEIRVTIYRPLPFAPLIVLGDRSGVRPGDDPRGRYCRAGGFLLSPEGEVLAAGEVRFAGSRAYTRRLARPFLETTPAETLLRLFPSARGQLGGEDGDGDELV
jgi:hypothetical protein